MLLNRQPTLHKPSIMSHRARVLKGKLRLRYKFENIPKVLKSRRIKKIEVRGQKLKYFLCFCILYRKNAI